MNQVLIGLMDIILTGWGLFLNGLVGKSWVSFGHVFEPIGMTSCTFHKKDPSDLVRIHFRKPDETLVLLKRHQLV